MTSERITFQKGGISYSKTVAGLMRLNNWGLSDEELIRWIEQCIEMGVSSFDHADIYGLYTCEERFGRALKKAAGLRSRIQLITKCGIQLMADSRPDIRVKHYNTSKEHIFRSVEQSLVHFGTDVIDLLLIHRPSPMMIAEETAYALNKLVETGKVKEVGVSNFTEQQVLQLRAYMTVPLATNQLECSLVQTDALTSTVFSFCDTASMRPMFWSPLGGGALFDEQSAVHQRIKKAQEKFSGSLKKLSLARLALAFLHSLPCKPSIVLGTGNIDRIREAVEAEKIKLPLQEWFMLLEASKDQPVP